ncbi:MAG TPA: 3-oxoacyl-ACP synthase, partial [Casimicrobiaceae bacterium]|nr:3-oxoacyl-ACP synthase [Casimicrobiaceae bacterium]
MHSRIAGTGRYLPSRVLTNAGLAERVATSDEWIRTRTGIAQRHIAADGEQTSDLALAAARDALAAASMAPVDVDLIIVATTTPD